MLRSKYLPVLLYGVESCTLFVFKRSLEFTVTRQLFQIGSAAIVIDCRKFIRCLPVIYQIDIRP